MFKLKITNKPEMIKMKCNIEFPNVVLVKLQEKEVTPTKEKQQIKADQQYDGLSKVVVNAIPDEYIIPSGEINISQNGTYDVTDKASANVNFPEKVLGTKTITINGTYKATDDNVDGYSEVEVATSGVDINDYYDLTKRNSGGISSYYIKRIPIIDTSDYKELRYFFSSMRSLEEIPQLNTSNSTSFYNFAQDCRKLISVPQLDFSNAVNLENIFYGCSSLTNLGGFKDLGKAYLTTASTNYKEYSLTLNVTTKYTHESLMNVINNLYDIKTKGCNTQRVIIGYANTQKLTAEEIAIATEKGWTVS